MSTNKISRRDFIKLSGTAAGGAVLAGCASTIAETPVATEAPEKTQAPVKTQAPLKTPQGNVVVFHDVKQLTPEMITQFESEHPGITIEFIRVHREPAADATHA